MSVTSDLEAINLGLADWIIHTNPAPNDAAGAASMKRAIELHNQLDQLLTKLQLRELQSTDAALALILAKHGTKLNELRAKIDGVASTLKLAESVISWAAQAVAIAVQVAALLA